MGPRPELTRRRDVYKENISILINLRLGYLRKIESGTCERKKKQRKRC